MLEHKSLSCMNWNVSIISDHKSSHPLVTSSPSDPFLFHAARLCPHPPPFEFPQKAEQQFAQWELISVSVSVLSKPPSPERNNSHTTHTSSQHMVSSDPPSNSPQDNLVLLQSVQVKFEDGDARSHQSPCGAGFHNYSNKGLTA